VSGRRAKALRKLARETPMLKYRQLKRDHPRVVELSTSLSEAALACVDASLARHKRFLERAEQRVMNHDLVRLPVKPHKVPRFAHVGWRKRWHPPHRSNRMLPSRGSGGPWLQSRSLR
jgi:hypothetical protein